MRNTEFRLKSSHTMANLRPCIHLPEDDLATLDLLMPGWDTKHDCVSHLSAAIHAKTLIAATDILRLLAGNASPLTKSAKK